MIGHTDLQYTIINRRIIQMFIDGEFEKEERGWEDFNEEYLENFIKRLIEQFREAFEGGASYYTVEGILINEIDRTVNEYDEEIIEFRVHIKYKDKPNSIIPKENEFTLSINTTHSSVIDFEEEVYDNIVNLIIFDGGN